jgi:hypothetical protein
MKVQKVWAVHQGDDDARIGHPAWFFTYEVDAKNAAKGKGWYGGEAPVSQRYILTCGKKSYLLARETPVPLDEIPESVVEKRKKILCKLTPEEREILGI